MSDSSNADGEWTGTRRRTMNENVLLRKNHTGKPRKATIPLPGASHRYGAPPKTAQAGVSDCLSWATEPPPAGVQAKRGIALPSDTNPKYTYGRSGGKRDNMAQVLAQTDKRENLVKLRERDAKIREAKSLERAIARLPGKTTRRTQTQRPQERAAPKVPFKLKRFSNVPPRVDTRRDSAGPAAAGADASGGAVEL
eukprot:a357111_75.p1 GENE.a357111_75~~a357111_75.p1  ORF type:complete len:208 (-),score=65.51 a357111_75:82-669(-)